MGGKDRRRGFVTIASGNLYYYWLAKNLLCSYMKHRTDDTPFAVICDRKCPEILDFDDVIIAKNLKGSYADKLLLPMLSPYEETIFIDADSLFISDPSIIWQDFQDMSDFSCYGRVLPLDSDKSWFYYNGIGEYRSQVTYGVNMHGGLYYFRKSHECKSMVERAIKIANEYSKYSFRVLNRVADEPVIALSMAVSGYRPCEKNSVMLFCPEDKGVKLSANGEIMLKKKACPYIVLHFATTNTRRYLYNYLVLKNENRLNKRVCQQLWLKTLPYDIRLSVKTKIRRILKSIIPFQTAKKIYTYIKHK